MKHSWAVALGIAAFGVATWMGWPPQEARVADGPLAGTHPAGMATRQEAPPKRHVLELPAIPAQGGQPATLQLTESTLRAALAHGSLLVRPGAGAPYRVRMIRGQREPGGAWTAVGRVQTRLGPQSMVVTVNGRDVFGVLPQADGTLLSITTTRGITSVEPAGGMVPPGHSALGNPDYQVPPAARPVAAGIAAAASRARVHSAASEPAGEARIDVLGLYSDDLVSLRGSVAAAETEVTNHVAIADQAHMDSGTHVRIRLAGMKQVHADPGLYNSELLHAITDEQLEGALRDEVAADLVFLDRPYHDGDPSCGNGWLNGLIAGTEFAETEYGYSVVNAGPCSPYVLAHELGHNMGSSHDLETATDANGVIQYGAFPWSFGFRTGGPEGFATIMAYPDQDMPRIGYFSDPGSSACGSPCGVDGRADNVRSLKSMAPTFAAFRGPPGSVVIADGARIEPFAGEQVEIHVPVRVSGVAPPGGLAFNVEVTGGTATPGQDYLVPESGSVVIAEGAREAYFLVRIVGDDEIEDDETLALRVSSLDGLAIEDPDSLVVIVDDDPSAGIEGRVIFPEGVAPPTTGWSLAFHGASVDGSVSRVVTVAPPDFSFVLPVVSGSAVTIDRNFPPAPFVGPPMSLGSIEGRVQVQYPVVVGARVSGKLRVPDGGPEPDAYVPVEITESTDGSVVGRHLFDLLSGDAYEAYVLPGALVNIRAGASGGYQPYWFRTVAGGDLAHDIELSTLPSLVVWAGEGIAEGKRETHGTVTFAFQLSAPAGEAGAQLSYRTIAGSASAGEDFTPAEGTLAFNPGVDFNTVSVDFPGDDRYEGDECFEMVAGDIQGAVATSPAQRFCLYDDDVHTGGPGQKQPSP